MERYNNSRTAETISQIQTQTPAPAYVFDGMSLSKNGSVSEFSAFDNDTGGSNSTLKLPDPFYFYKVKKLLFLA